MRDHLDQDIEENLIAPGADAVLATVFVDFCIGPKCLMDPAGDIARDCRVAILSSYARDAWDTSNKLCESLKRKESEQL